MISKVSIRRMVIIHAIYQAFLKVLEESLASWLALKAGTHYSNNVLEVLDVPEHWKGFRNSKTLEGF